MPLGMLWAGKPDGFLPCRMYETHCTLSAKAISEEACGSWLNSTYLANRITMIGRAKATPFAFTCEMRESRSFSPGNPSRLCRFG